MTDVRYLLLAEGFSADPHYGKDRARRAPYRRDDVVAILDSTRAGEVEDGVPVVASVDDALRFAPTTALVGVATQGGRFPPEWIEILKGCVAAGLDILKTATRLSRRRSRACGASARADDVEAA